MESSQRARKPWGAAFLALGVVALVVTVGMLPGSAGTPEKLPWTAAGSTGVIDEDDTDELKFSADRVQFKNGADLPATATIRYNITALNSLQNYDTSLLLASVEDNGSNGRVLMEIVEYGFETNDSQVIHTLDSNDFGASDEPLTVYEDCGGNFNFADNTYMVRVTLEKTGSEGTPALHDLVVVSEACP